MNILRRILTGTALALAISSFAMADTVTTTATLSSVLTDITDSAVAITPFTPGANGVPVGSVLTGFTIQFAETIAGSVTVTNTGSGATNATESIDSQGILSLFTSIGNGGTDAFGGSGPDATYTSGKIALAKGGSNTNPSYTGSDTQTTSLDTTPADLTAAQSAWDVYVSTGTTSGSKFSGGGNGTTAFTNKVSGVFTVTYDYSSSPEPATMVLFGTALVGLGLFRKRILK